MSLLCLIVVYLSMSMLTCDGFVTFQSHHGKRYRRNDPVGANTILFESTFGIDPNNSKIIIKQDQIDLSTGINAEIMYCRPTDDKTPLSSLQMVFSSKPKPPLVFIHGSFHASWCWAEKFFPYFADLGYSCYALSLRGTGGSYAGEGVKKVKIMDHVSDIESFLEYVNEKEENGQVPPVILGHSFGGLAIMKLLEKNLPMDHHKKEKIRNEIPDFLGGKDSNIGIQNDEDTLKLKIKLSGVCLMCSVPPSGNGRMTLRFLKRSLRDSWKITAGLALKKCIKDEKLCRDLFFGGDVFTMYNGNDPITEDWGVSDEDLRRYQGYFERDTVATISLRDLAKKLPSANTDDGIALFRDALPPSFVIGAKDDFIVDRAGVVETAKYFDVDPVYVDAPHDVMLGKKWKNTATSISQWLESITE